jgi:hypothetical protein
MDNSKKKDSFLTAESLPFIETGLDFDVEIEIIESGSYDACLDEFTKLSAKAVSEYSSRLDDILRKHGPAAFYKDYIRWRTIAAAVQGARRALNEMELLKQDMTESNRQKAEFLKEVEELFGADVRNEIERLNMVDQEQEL